MCIVRKKTGFAIAATPSAPLPRLGRTSNDYVSLGKNREVADQ
jgi:hypothetical protein